jgi:two-component sensor histidine kinase
MNIPLIVQNETIGLMNIGTINPSAFTPEYIDIASEVGDSLAVAIRQAQLHEQVQQVAETKARLLREVNHRVRNNLTAIISLLSLEQGRTEVDNQATYQAIMEDLIRRIQGLATVHHLVSVTNWSALSLSELTEQVINSALQALPPDKYVSVEVSTSPIQIPPQEANNLALLVNELTTNAIKYAWPARQTGRIGVNIDREDDQVLLEFRDDGVGYSDEVLSLELHSIGWELIQAIVVDGLQGEVTLHNDRGAVTTIRFPAPV